MAKRHFERGGRGVFTCYCCGRSTRQTTQGGDSELCAECWELAGCENSLLDGVQTLAEIKSLRDSLVADAVSKGGSAEKIRATFKTPLFAEE